jgi:hypothetical protein
MWFERLLGPTVNQLREVLKVARKPRRQADHAVGMVAGLFVLHDFQSGIRHLLAGRRAHPKMRLPTVVHHEPALPGRRTVCRSVSTTTSS